jgi:ubiquitin-protein ligase
MASINPNSSVSNNITPVTQTVNISKETIIRLLKDVKQIIKNPLIDNGIYYKHDETDMMKGYALIIGPSETPYFAGNYLFELNFPTDYPHTPPTVKYMTNGDGIRFNPNLYKCGKVCVSLLNTWRGDQWTSCQTISTVLLTLCSLLCKDPLLNEPGISRTHPDMINYSKIIEYANIDIAVCNILLQKTGYYMKQFEMFFPIIKEQFLKNYDAILDIVNQRCASDDFKNKICLRTSMYSMNVNIDYAKLKCVLETINNEKMKL